VDVVFVIDTSRSMLSQDVLPSRLERAKLAIYDCLEKMDGNRVGLVAFAGDAFLQCPLTLDYDAFRQTLESVDTNTIADGGTDIAVGLDVAAKALEESGNHKIIVLLTDGEDLEGQGVGEAKVLADQGVTIYTVGVGTPQGEIIPIRNANGQTDFVRDERGEIVKSHLDSDTLSQIATVTKGFYQPLGATGEGLTKVYEDGIKKMPEQKITSQMRQLPIERFQWPLAAAFILLTVEMLLGTRRPSWRSRTLLTAANLSEPIPVSAATVSAKKLPAKPTTTGSATAAAMVRSLLLLVGIFAFTTSRAQTPAAATDNSTTTTATASSDTAAPSGNTATEQKDNKNPSVNYTAKDAEALFQTGNYSAAAEAYKQVAEATPQDSRFRYDQGESLYRNGNFEDAAVAFTRTLSSNDLALQQQAYYNMGNAHYRLGQSQLKDDPDKTMTTWESAEKDYQNALELNAGDADARYNLDLVKAQIEQLKKKQQQQQQQNQDQKNSRQQPQDQKNQDQKNNQNQNNQNQQNKNDQNQKNQDQNKQNQQNKNDQNQQSKNDQNQQNQNNQNGQNQQPKPQNGTGDKNQNQPQQNQSGQQKPQNGNQNQPQSKPDQGTSPQNQAPEQKPGSQQQSAQPQGSAGTGQEPKPHNQGQQTTPQSQAQGAKGTSTPNGTVAPTGTATANVVGVMSRDDAKQLLDSLKVYERKLPAAPAQSTSTQKSDPDQFHKDW